MTRKAPRGARTPATQAAQPAAAKAHAGDGSPAPADVTVPTLATQLFVEAVRRHAGGQLQEAEALYQAIRVLNPRHAEAAYNQGIIQQTTGRRAEALATYRASIFARPEFVDPYCNLGSLLQESGQLEEAAAVLRQAIQLKPDFAMAWLNLGVTLKEQGKAEEAIQAYHQAIRIKPDYDQAYANLSAVLLEENRPEESVAAARQAVTINPTMALGYCNLAAGYKAMNRLAEAETAYRGAVASRPDFPEAHFGLSQILLLQGRLPAAWEEYEWRWQLREYGWLKAIHGDFRQPRWQGEPLNGRTILIYAEQGLGDTMQFSRFLALVQARGGRIVLAVQPPLLALLQHSLPDVTVVPLDRTPLPPFDVHIPLLSLPRVLGIDLAQLPMAVSYLRAEPEAVGRWHHRIRGHSPDRLKVGIIWAGNPQQRGDKMRSPRLAAVRPLFGVPGTDFFSLQLGPGRQDIVNHPLPVNVTDLAGEITSLADTAAIMSNLDLVITSCTAPLHLGGALGVRTWALIPYAPHFFWLLDRSDSPWYPSLTLYRQDRAGRDWGQVVGRLGADLAALAAMPRIAAAG